MGLIYYENGGCRENFFPLAEAILGGVPYLRGQCPSPKELF